MFSYNLYMKNLSNIFLLSLLFSTILVFCSARNLQQTLQQSLQALRNNRSLMGIAFQLTNNSQIIYNSNVGLKDGSKAITNQTMFRVASLSKSVAAVGIMQLVQAKKVSLTTPISTILGFNITNPHFPSVDITLQMVLSHQSSIVECNPYYPNFIDATYSAKDGFSVPNVSQLLVPGGKFYNACMFSTRAPGTIYSYANINFGLTGTFIQKISGVRFDIYMKENILKYLSAGLAEQATYNAGYVKDIQNLGTLFTGSNGKWVQSYDYYPDGKIPQRNMTGYIVGKNGVVFGPQGGLRASVSHLNNYMITLRNGGTTKQGARIISSQSVKQMLKPRYHYRGPIGGSANEFHTYGIGLYQTTYRGNDRIISHQVVQGHLGAAYGLISGYHFWKNYTMSYIINGALNGYQYGTGTIYEGQRLWIHKAVENYINLKQIENEIKEQPNLRLQ